MFSSTNDIVLLAAGVCLFLYGMTLAAQALEKLLASRLSRLMNRLGDNNFLAIVVGVSLTAILQSSGAVTSMLVGLGSAKVINLRQVMGVIIGTAIGSTLTVQLISLHLNDYALPLIIASFSIYFLTKRPGLKNFSLVFLGFGFLFLGLEFLSVSAKNLSQYPNLTEYLGVLKTHPYWSLIISMIFCALVHSSAVTIGLAMTLNAAGVIDLPTALFWVYGANIGTTSTALLAAVGSNYVGKQVAWAHFFYKFVSVLLFLIPWVHNSFVEVLQSFNMSDSRFIANGHLYFNLASALLFYPFISAGAKLIEWLFPKNPDEDFRLQFLSLNNYQSSALAVSYAEREILRLADIVVSMIQDSLKLIQTGQPQMIESIKDRDKKVDYLYREVKMFLLDHVNKSQTFVHQNIMNLIMFASDLERAADSIDINLMQLAIKKSALKLEFSEDGWNEIQYFHGEVLKLAQISIASFQLKELCPQAIDLKRELTKVEMQLRENHIGRLNRGMRESINTSSIHLDLLSEYKRIASLLCNHAYNQK